MPNEAEQLAYRVNELIEKNGYLDHAARATEELISSRIKDALYMIKEKQDNGEEISEYEHERLDSTLKYFFRIYKYETDVLKAGKSRVYYFLNGTNISYSSYSKLLEKEFSIAHELGHSLMHVDWECTSNKRLVGYHEFDSVKETEACEFAKLILCKRRAQYQDPQFISEHIFYDEELENLMKKST